MISPDPRRIASGVEEGHWCIDGGTPVRQQPGEKYRADGISTLSYNNPWDLTIERVWFDGKVVYAIEQGELEVDFSKVKVANEYQIVYAVDLDEQGKLRGEPERVDGQYNIYDSVPGMDKYSPLWRFSYVIVPRDYEPNSLRSELDCLRSGYEIRQSSVVEN